MRKKWLFGSVVAAAVILAGARAALPWALKTYANSKMQTMGDYTGRVADIDVALLRGAYTLRDLVIDKRAADTQAHFVDLATADISLQWAALLSGELVGEIVAETMSMNLVQGETERDTQLGAGVNWTDRIKELFPFRFNRVEVSDGRITFRAPGIEADDVLTVSDGHLILENLTNAAERDQDAFADVNFSGNIMSNAPLLVGGRINPNASTPTFDIDIELEGTKLVDVNPWLDKFLSIDAEDGIFSMYAELAATDGRFEGYVKPIMENAKVFGAEESGENAFRRAWEAIVEVAGEIFENQQSDQVATEIPLSGELENPDAGALVAIVNLLRNAFVSAFSHSLEGSVSLRDVGADGEDGVSSGPRIDKPNR